MQVIFRPTASILAHRTRRSEFPVQGNEAAVYPQHRRSIAGLTLIEVLVATVILAIGILVVLKIFPVGFGTIDISHQRTVATALASNEIERYKQYADDMYLLPDAIIATDPSIIETELVPLVDYNPNSVVPAEQTNLILAAPPTSDISHNLWEPQSLYLPRTILGEGMFIRANMQFVNFAPLAAIQATQDNGSGVNLGIRIYEYYPYLPNEDATLQDDERRYILSSTNPNEFYVPITDAGRYFRLSYTWLDGTIYRRVVAETQLADAGGLMIANHEAIPGTESVYRELTYEPIPANLGANEFSLETDSSLTGKIYFYALNTLGHPSEDYNKLVKIDYAIQDWAIMSEDHIIPANTTDLRVTVTGGIKDEDYTNPPRQPNPMPLYVGNIATPEDDRYVIAVDLDSGDIYHDAPDTGNLNMLSRDYVNGRLVFPASSSKRRWRIFYRARDDWAVQVTKPSAVYNMLTPVMIGDQPPMPDERHFAWDPANNQDTIYFTRSDEGKIVAVSYYDTSMNYVSGKLFRIPAPVNAPAYISMPAPETMVCGLKLDPTPNEHSTIVAYGSGMKTRVLWVGPGKSEVPIAFTLDYTANQKKYLNEAWRQSEITTFLR